MALFNKSDMQFADYKWTAYPNDDPKVIGPPDSTLFNRHEGYEVLYLINKLAEIWDFKRKSSGEKMERMIRSSLPSEMVNQDQVRKWIHDNWDNHK